MCWCNDDQSLRNIIMMTNIHSKYLKSQAIAKNQKRANTGSSELGVASSRQSRDFARSKFFQVDFSLSRLRCFIQYKFVHDI